MDELVVEVEDHLQQPGRIAEELQLRLGLKIEVRTVQPLSLPRSEGKGQRFVDERGKEQQNSRTAEQQNSRTAEQQNSRTAEQ
jgi:hypothetical protein